MCTVASTRFSTFIPSLVVLVHFLPFDIHLENFRFVDIKFLSKSITSTSLVDLHSNPYSNLSLEDQTEAACLTSAKVMKFNG